MYVLWESLLTLIVSVTLGLAEDVETIKKCEKTTWVEDNIRFMCVEDGTTTTVTPTRCICKDKTELERDQDWTDEEGNFIWNCFSPAEGELSFTIRACLTPSKQEITIGETKENWVCEVSGETVSKYYQEETQCKYNGVQYDVGATFPNDDGTAKLKCLSDLTIRANWCIVSEQQTIKVNAIGTVDGKTMKCIRESDTETSLQHAGSVCVESDGKTKHNLTTLWEKDAMLYKCQLDGLTPVIKIKKCMHVLSEAETVPIPVNSINKAFNGTYYWCKKLGDEKFEVVAVSPNLASCAFDGNNYANAEIWGASGIRMKCKWSSSKGKCVTAEIGCINDNGKAMSNEDIMENNTKTGANICKKENGVWIFSALSEEEYNVWKMMEGKGTVVSGTGTSGSGSQHTGTTEAPKPKDGIPTEEPSSSDSTDNNDKFGTLDESGKCTSGNQKVDMVFVVDNSGSIKAHNFDTVKKFLSSLVDSFDIGADKVQIATVKYSGMEESGYKYRRVSGQLLRDTTTVGTHADTGSGIHIIHHLNKFSTKDSIKAAISSMHYSGGKTATGGALSVVRNQALTAVNGSRPDAKHVCVVFTDGETNDGIEPLEIAQKLTENGTIIYAVGITTGVGIGELLDIAQSEKRVHHIKDFDSLEPLKSNITKMICEGETTQDTVKEMEETEAEKYHSNLTSAWNKLKQSLISFNTRSTAQVPKSFSGFFKNRGSSTGGIHAVTPTGGTNGGTTKGGTDGGTSRGGTNGASDGETSRGGTDGGTSRGGTNGGTFTERTNGGTTKRGTDGGTPGGSDGGTSRGGTNGGTTKGGTDGGTYRGGTNGGTTKGGTDGGTYRGGTNGGTTKGGIDGGSSRGGTDGGTTKEGTNGGTTKGGTNGGTTKGGTYGGTPGGTDGGTSRRGTNGGTTEGGTDGGTPGGSDGGTSIGEANGGTTKRATDGGTPKGGSDGGTSRGGTDGGTSRGGTDGGTSKGGTNGGSTKGGTDGGTFTEGTNGGSTKGGTDGGTFTEGTNGGSAKGGTDGGTPGESDGGTSRGETNGGTTKRGTDGGTPKGGSDGGTTKGGTAGGTSRGGTDGGTTKGGSDGGTSRGGTNGGTTKRGSDGGTPKESDVGTTKRGTDGGTLGGSDGRTTKGGTNSETTKGGSDGGTTKGGTNGETTKGGSDGGTPKGGTDGGTTKGGTDGGTTNDRVDTYSSGRSGGTSRGGAPGVTPSGISGDTRSTRTADESSKKYINLNAVYTLTLAGTSAVTFEEATNLCQNNNPPGTLPSFRDRHEFESICKFRKESSINHAAIWTALKYNSSKSSWTYTDGLAYIWDSYKSLHAPQNAKSEDGQCGCINGFGKLETKSCSDKSARAAVICLIDSQEFRVQEELKLPTPAETLPDPVYTAPDVTMPKIGTFNGHKCSLNSGTLLDLVIVVDDSGSIGRKYFDKVIDFLSKLTPPFASNTDSTQIAVVKYSGTTSYGIETIQSFKSAKYSDEIVTNIMNMKYNGGRTATGEALYHVDKNVLNEKNGMRKKAQQALLVITDGETNCGRKPKNIAAKLLTQNVPIFAVGVTKNISTRHLMEISHSPERIIQVEKFKNLNTGIRDELITMIVGKGPDSQAERIKLEQLLPGQIPETTRNPIPVQTESVAPLGTVKDGKCINPTLKLDLMLVLDESGSVGYLNFKKLKSFLIDFVGGFDIGQEKIQVATITYSGVFYKGVHTVHDLNDFSNADEIKQVIQKIPYRRGKTATGQALRYLKSNVCTAANGKRSDAKCVVIVFTDGNNNDGEKPGNPASALINDNCIVYAVGITKGIKFEQLKEIAKRDDRIFQVDHFDQLNAVVKDEVTKLICGQVPEGNDVQREQEEQKLPVSTVTATKGSTVTQPAPTLGVFAANKCRTSTRKLDLVLLLDESGSVGKNNYEKMKRFCADFIDVFDIDSGLVEVATVRYSGKRYWGVDHVEHGLGELKTKAEIKTSILNMPYRRGATATGDALKFLYHNVVWNGGRSDAQKIVLVLTDGRTNDGDPPYNHAAALLKAHCLIYAIGISRGITQQQLMDITLDNSRIFQINNFDELQSGIRDSICVALCGEGPASQTDRLAIEAEMPTVTTPAPGPLVTYNTPPPPTLGTFQDSDGKCVNPSLQLDLVFVVDESGSVGRRNFKRLRTFLASLVDSFEIGKDKVRVATIKYSGVRFWGVRKVHDFDDFLSSNDLRSRISTMKYKGGRTATGRALEFVLSNILTASGGARSGVPKVVIVFTDGKTNTGIKPSQPASKLMASGAVVYSVGIGKGIKKDELLSIAKSEDRLYQVDNFADLGDSIKKAIISMVCNGNPVTVPPPPPTPNPVAPVLGDFKKSKCEMSTELLDLVLILDESGSVGLRNYKKMKNFGQSLVDSFSVDDGTVQIALVKYSGEKYYGIHIESYLNSLKKAADVKNKIADMSYKKGATATGAALNLVRHKVLVKKHGMRDKAHKIIVLLTDGNTNDGIKPKSPANDLRKDGVIIYVVGITNGIKDSEMVEIAGDNHRIFHVDNFLSLGDQLRDSIAGAVCGTENEDEKRTSKELALEKSPVTLPVWRGGSVDKEAPDLGAFKDGKCTLSDGGELDLVLIVDESGSVGRANFEKVKTFASKVVDTFGDGLNSGRVRLAVVKYSGSRWYGVECVHYLRETVGAAQAKKAILDMAYLGGATATGLALEFVRISVLTAQNGKRSTAKTVILVVTDGACNDGIYPSYPAKALVRNRDAMIYAIGVTRGVRRKQLYDISQSYDRILHQHKFDSLGDNLKNNIGLMICGNGTRGEPTHGWGMHGGRCYHPRKAEIVFAIPDTKSTGYSNYDKMKNFVVNFTGSLSTEKGKVRVGYVQYSGVVDNGIGVEAWLHHNLRGDILRHTIATSLYTGGKKHANGEAIARIHQNMFAEIEESRGRPDRILIFLTDNMNNDGLGHSMRGAAKKIDADKNEKGKPIRVYGVGITNNADFYELKTVTKTSQRIYMLEDWADINYKFKTCLLRSLCDQLNGRSLARDVKECLAYHYPLKKSGNGKKATKREMEAGQSGSGSLAGSLALILAAILSKCF